MNFKLCITIFLSILICACIPYNTRTTEVCRVGERYSNDGKLISYIEKRAKQDDIYVIISPDGGFKNTRYVYYKYFLKDKDNSEISLKHLDEHAGLKRYLEPILPVENTNYWITFWEANDKDMWNMLLPKLKKEFNDFRYILCVLVFDKNGIIYSQYVPEIEYNRDNWGTKCGFYVPSCGHDTFPSLKGYYIEATEGNHTITFKTMRGDYVYHVDGNILEKKK